jgi:hypothetical protein
MFKSKEDLKQKPSTGKNLSDAKYYFNCGIDSAFHSIAERIVFYEKYKDKDADFFWEEQKEIFNNVYLKYLEGRYEKLFPELVMNLFHDWLFHFCFDEIEEKKVETPSCGAEIDNDGYGSD